MRPPAYIADLKIVVVDKPLVCGVDGSLKIVLVRKRVRNTRLSS